MQDSITMADVGSIVKVSGNRIATPLGPPSPGSTPTKMPSTSPTIIRASVFHVSRTAKPCRSRPKASIRPPNTQRPLEAGDQEKACHIKPEKLRHQAEQEGRHEHRHDPPQLRARHKRRQGIPAR